MSQPEVIQYAYIMHPGYVVENSDQFDINDYPTDTNTGLCYRRPVLL